jgi:hypothetical protein
MTRELGRPATYDQMMAELQLDSEEDEREAKAEDRWQGSRKRDARESRRHSTQPSPKHEDKPKLAADKDSQRSDAKTLEAEAKDAESRRRRLSFPHASEKLPVRRSSSSYSRSHNSDGAIPSDSDDSDQEREGKTCRPLCSS